MKNLLFLFSILCVSFTSLAQSSGDSVVSMQEAKAIASSENKAILMVFSGSDWCRPCIQFKKEVLADEAFKNYASDKLVVLYLDFPSRKKNKLPEAQAAHNEQIAEKFNKGGAFPKIILLDKDEQIIGELSYNNQGATGFIENCTALLPND